MHQRYAGFWIRLVANLVDGLILAIPLYFIDRIAFYFATGEDTYQYYEHAIESSANAASFEAFPLSYLILSFIGSSLVGILYYGLYTASSHQATPGKILLGIRVINADGQRISFGRSVGRYFAYIPSGLILNIGYMMAGWNDEKRALHDYLAGTYVIYNPIEEEKEKSMESI